MPDLLQVIETIRAEEASVQKLFGGEGQGAHTGARSASYKQRLAEAAKLIADVLQGRKGTHYLREAMTTSDFPILFGDILDRQMLAAYREYPSTWQNYVHRATVRDFRTVERHPGILGADQELAEVKEQGEYTEAALSEQSPYTYKVAKHGRRVPISWETLINDDLDRLTDIPTRLGRAARRSESRFATRLHADANGPHAALYTVGNKNIVTGNPALSIVGLQSALLVLAAQVDEQNEPILVETVELVVPPALEIVAQNILNATQLELSEAGATSGQKMMVANWMRNRLRLNVDPYHPLVANSANGSTAWYLFANPSNGRPALEMGFLRGHEEPEIFIKTPNAQRVGGGAINATDGDFDTDSIEYKVRHVFGGTRLDPKMTVASQGDGS